jgi:hypothetical protein
MKKKTDKKFVTLPIGNVEVFKRLADIAWSVQEDRDSFEKDDFYDFMLQLLGEDAFLYSFTPSGEIGSGHGEYSENPQTPRISASFYGAFPEFKKDGLVNTLMSKHTKSDKVKKNRILRFKSAVINLIQIYVDARLGLKTDDRDTSDQRKQRRANAKEGKATPASYTPRITSFNFKKRTTETDEEWMAYLIGVEQNRYKRLFVATIFFSTIIQLFEISMTDIDKLMTQLDLANIEGMSDPKKVYKKLMSDTNRDEFVMNIRNLWKIKVDPKQVSNKDIQNYVDEHLPSRTTKAKRVKKGVQQSLLPEE